MAESFTNQSREQAESKSSFFKREKILGAFRTRRSKISGTKFKKGTSQESTDNIEKRVGANEKKITLLKKIVKLRKENVDKQLGTGGSPLFESLQAIAATTDSIKNTLIQQQDSDKSTAEKLRREKEEQEREGQEKGLENTKPKLLQKIADPVIKPVMSLWEKIWNFIKTLFLGKILMNFLDWFGNPENQGKIITLVRFVKDWWPALVGAVLLFGTGFGGLVTGLTVAIATFIPKMLAAIAALKASKLGALVGGKAGLIKGGLLVGGGMLAGMGISKMMGNNEGESVSNEKVQGLNKGGQVRGSGNKDTVPAMLTPGEFVMSKGAVQKYGVDTMESINAAAGGTNRPTLMSGFNEGGVVTDPEERKQQEAYMLKFVNEERALQGLEPLNDLTYAPGVELTKMMGPGPRTKETSDTNFDFDKGIKTTSTSKTVDGKTSFSAEMGQTTDEDKQKFFAENPQARQLVNIKDQAELDALGADISASAKMNGGGLVQGFKGGGLVTVEPGTINSYQDAIDAGIKVEDFRAGPGKRFGEIWWKEKQPKGWFGKQKYIRKGTAWYISSVGGGAKEKLAMSTEDFVNMKMGWAGASSAKVQSKAPPKLDRVTGDPGKRTAPKLDRGGNIDAMVNTDKYKVKPKEKKNVVVAYNEEVDKNKETKQPAGGGNDIPSFDVRPKFMTNEDKLMVLGIMV